MKELHYCPTQHRNSGPGGRALRGGSRRDCPDCSKPSGRVTNWGMDREDLLRVDL